MTLQGSQTIPELPFDYSLVRSNRKTVAIHVSAKGVSIRIPHHVTDEFALAFLLKKSAWVQSKLKAQSHVHALLPKLEVGSSILWQGQKFIIDYRLAKRRGLIMNEQSFIVEAPEWPNASQLLDVFSGYFKQQAKHYLTLETMKQAERMNLFHKLDSVKFRRTKSKWGHCTSKGVIQYNWLIMGAPISVIQYLVVHEVAHLKYPHHQSAFWDLVERYCPDYKESNLWLKENGVKLGWC